jgi:hypothetical protein
MKLIACASLSTILGLTACGGGAKPAEEPENATEEGNASADPGASDKALGAPKDEAPIPSASKPVGDDTAKVASPCTGFDIPDLMAVVSQASCEAPDVKPDAQQKDLKDLLEIKVTVDSAVINPGSTAQVTVAYHNKGKTDLPLFFVVDPEPRFSFEAYTLKGDRADNPAGSEPSLPPEVANAQAPEAKVAKVTIASQGTAKLVLKWDAVKYKWASKERAKGALPGHGYPRDPAGPLKKGKYVLRVVTPLTGVFEGVDHELSQPRAQVVVGGAAVGGAAVGGKH